MTLRTPPKRVGLRPWIVCLAGFVWLGMIACASQPEPAPTVIVLSLDGVRHDFNEGRSLPAFERVAEAGLRAERLVPVFPSSTFPGHVSIATGTYPDRHGIVNNTFWDRERGLYDYESDASWIEAEPLWIAAERQGVPTAVLFWVGSETDWRGRGARYRAAPFDSSVPESDKVDRILAWLDLPEAEAPRLIMSWWHGADTVEHRRGPAAPEVTGALQSQDRELQRLLDGLDAREGWSRTTLLIVSDHGMTELRELVALDAVLRQASIGARVLAGAAVAHVFLDEPDERDTAARLLAALPSVQVYTRETLPDAFRLAHPTRTGDLVAVASPPAGFARADASKARSAPLVRRLDAVRGAHGYAPELADMGAILLAVGRAVPPGERIGAVRGIDVAATIAKLLGIEAPADSEGEPIAGFAWGEQ